MEGQLSGTGLFGFTVALEGTSDHSQSKIYVRGAPAVASCRKEIIHFIQEKDMHHYVMCDKKIIGAQT